MADIALLIVEDYESRMTRSIEKAGGIGNKQGEDLGFFFRSRRSLGEYSWIKNVQEKFDFAKRTLSPESEVSLAARNGFFSA